MRSRLLGPVDEGKKDFVRLRTSDETVIREHDVFGGKVARFHDAFAGLPFHVLAQVDNDRERFVDDLPALCEFAAQHVVAEPGLAEKVVLPAATYAFA